jgi:hypothetical protein
MKLLTEQLYLSNFTSSHLGAYNLPKNVVSDIVNR